MTGSQVLELSCERMSYGPDAVARDAGGRTVFVSGGVAGDRVRAVVDREEERWAHATVVEVVDPSSHRVLPACPFAGACSGCPWSALSYPIQAASKRAAVVDALTRPCIPRTDLPFFLVTASSTLLR